MLVELEPLRRLAQAVPLARLKEDPALEGMALVRRGNRLSVMPVDDAHFRQVLELGGTDRTRCNRRARGAPGDVVGMPSLSRKSRRGTGPDVLP